MSYEDVFHNNFNYHQKFTKSQMDKRNKIVEKFLDSFVIIDWFGHEWKECKEGHIANIDFPITWNDIMESLYNSLLPYKDHIIIDQIKEKFGGLRVYYATHGKCSSDEKDIDNIIDKHCKMINVMYLLKNKVNK